MIACEHQWQKIHEEFLLGGTFPIGYKCKLCNKFINITDIPITGISGIDTGEQVLFGPHGCKSKCSDGSTYTKQTLYPGGSLVKE